MTRESNRQAVLLSLVSPIMKDNNDDPILITAGTNVSFSEPNAY